MFKATATPQLLKTVVEALLSVVDEAVLQISPEGVTARAADASHVAMVQLTVPAKAFSEFKATPLRLGVKLDRLKEILALAQTGDIVRMEHNETQNRLTVTVGNVVRRMSLIDTSNLPDPKMPDLKLPGRVRAKLSEVLLGLKASGPVHDEVAFKLDAEAFELLTEGDQDTVSLRIPKAELIELHAPEATKSLFALDFLKKLVDPAEPEAPLTLELGTDYPMRATYELSDGLGSVTCVLAPRIVNE